MAPRLEIFPESPQIINKGHSVLYQCNVVAGVPSPVITWSRTDQRPLTSNTEVLSGGLLRIARTTGEEEGEYRCRGENIAGSAEATTSLTIRETPSSPRIQMRPRGSVTVREGSLLTLSCEVAGDPTPSLTWQKISSSGSRQVIGTDTPTLIITYVDPEDEGTYVCVASSLAGQVEDRLQVSLADNDEADNQGERISGLFKLSW